MVQDKFKRKLTAILSADGAAYRGEAIAAANNFKLVGT